MTTTPSSPGSSTVEPRPAPGPGFALLFLPAAAFTWGIHELAHWQMGRSLGYRMWISLNQVGLVEGEYHSDTHEILVSMAGPAVTYLQALVAFALIRGRGALGAYPFLFLALWTRGLAMVMGLANPNDEARASELLGASPWLLPGVVVVLLLALTVSGSRRLRIGWKGNGVGYLMSSIATAAIVLGDPGPLFEG